MQIEFDVVSGNDTGNRSPRAVPANIIIQEDEISYDSGL
jgi:hypothetical protein